MKIHPARQPTRELNESRPVTLKLPRLREKSLEDAFEDAFSLRMRKCGRSPTPTRSWLSYRHRQGAEAGLNFRRVTRSRGQFSGLVSKCRILIHKNEKRFQCQNVLR
jgi:hypothetical protein